MKVYKEAVRAVSQAQSVLGMLIDTILDLNCVPLNERSLASSVVADGFAKFQVYPNPSSEGWKFNEAKQKYEKRSAKLDSWVAIDWWILPTCVSLDCQEEEAHSCNSCRHRQVGKSAGELKGWEVGNPISTHRLRIDGFDFNVSQVLDPCD